MFQNSSNCCRLCRTGPTYETVTDIRNPGKDNCSFHNIIHPFVGKNISPNNFILQNSHSKLGPTKNSQVVSEIISKDKCINMLWKELYLQMYSYPPNI